MMNPGSLHYREISGVIRHQSRNNFEVFCEENQEQTRPGEVNCIVSAVRLGIGSLRSDCRVNG